MLTLMQWVVDKAFTTVLPQTETKISHVTLKERTREFRRTFQRFLNLHTYR